MTNGTVTGTRLVRDIRPGDADGMAPLDDQGSQRVALNGTLLFRANDGVAGLELWRSDATAAGPELWAATVLPRDSGAGIAIAIVSGGAVGPWWLLGLAGLMRLIVPRLSRR